MHKKYRRFWAFSSVLLLVAQIGVSALLAFPSPVHAAQNLEVWASTHGTLNPADIDSSRFTFIDPITIKDTTTNSTYKTTASSDELYTDSTRGHMREPGWFWYWPGDGDGPTINESSSNPQCTGALVLRASDGDYHEIRSISLYAVGAAKNSSGTCGAPNGSSDDFDEFQGDFTGKGDDPHDDNEYGLDLDNETYRMAVAMFSWQNNSHIATYDNGEDLRKVTDDELEGIKRRIDDTFSGRTVWTADQCEQGGDSPLNAFLVISDDSQDAGRLYYDDNGSYHDSWNGEQLDCIFGRNLTDNQSDLAGLVSDGSNVVYVAHSERASEEGDPPPGEGGGDDEEGENDTSCESAGDFAWALCPVVLAVSGAVNWTTTQVSALLEADRDSYTNDELYKGWANIRNIALSLLIVLMLVMVIATALDTQLFDAYTVKRALPRMVAAILFIVLSWYICVILIDIFNALGRGIMGIMTSPFNDGNGLDFSQVFTVNSFEDIIGQWLGAVGLAIGILLVIVFFGFTILLFVGVAFLVLIIRQLFILLLMLLAPLAILAWIFPGNDKLWKLWWGSFSKLLMMYPLIMGLLAAGRIFAFLIGDVNHAGGIQGTIDPLLKVIAFTVPFAAIPMTFKFAGGMFATIAGMANDKSKGLFDRASKRRQAKAQRWAGGNAFKGAGEHTRRGRMNERIEQIANARHAGANPLAWKRNTQAAAASATLAHAMEGMEKDAAFQPIKGNDDLLAAATHGRGTMADARAYLEARGQTGSELNQNLALIDRAKKSMGNRGFAIAAAVANAGTGTGYGSGSGEMLDAINRAAGGNMAIAGNMLAAARGRAEQARRFDLSGAGFGDQFGQMQAINRAQTPADSAHAIQHATDFLADRALDAQGPGAMLGGRGRSVENLVPAMQRRIERSMDEVHAAHASGDQGRIQTAQRNMQQTLASTAGLLDVAGQVSPENARMLADGVLSGTITDVNGRQATVGQVIELNRSNQEFQEMRREYGAQQAQQYQNAQAAAQGTPGQAPPIVP